MAAKVYVAKETIHVQTKTGVVTIYKGERVREGHEYMRGREDSFMLPDNEVMYDVEQATKAPGEKRGEAKA
jgi:hypothetical protein